jgi:hypothetical protein
MERVRLKGNADHALRLERIAWRLNNLLGGFGHPYISLDGQIRKN